MNEGKSEGYCDDEDVGHVDMTSLSGHLTSLVTPKCPIN